MSSDIPEKPSAPDLPQYLREPLEKQSAERLEIVATYARALAEWKRQQRQHELERRQAEEEIDYAEREELADREIATEPEAYENVPARAYITVKETKPGYRYYYWQWREGDTWKNEYIAPVSPKGN